ALARFEANGSLDPSFGGGGTVVTDFGGDDSVAALAVQPDGKLVAAGRTGSDVALARYGTTSTPTSSSTSTSTSTSTTTSTTTTLPVPSPFTEICAALQNIRATFEAQAWLRPFVSIIDGVGATLGCS
ncbi:MAG TPA: hypothetical protein VM030_09055, partial [Acidimicrobiales bacterium]|nr:hypothetical protein [Acidimicrobiales bacterium]